MPQATFSNDPVFQQFLRGPEAITTLSAISITNAKSKAQQLQYSQNNWSALFTPGMKEYILSLQFLF